MATDSRLDVLRQELQGARARQRGALLVIAPPLIAAEPVPGGRIDVHGQVGLRGPDTRVVLGRDGLVRLAEMEEDGTARRLRRGVGHAAAVVADGGPHAVHARCGQPGQGAAQAIADHTHLEALARQRLHGRADVLDHVVHVDLAADAAAELDVLRLVAGLEAALGAIEDGRGQRHVTLRGEAVGDLPDVAVDAKDLLDDDEPALGGALGRRPVARELVAVFRCQRDHLAHTWILRRSAQRGPAFKGGCGVRATSYLSRGAYWGGAIRPTTWAPRPIPGMGLNTTVSACAGRNPLMGRTARPCVTSTSVPGPRQADTISFNSTNRKVEPGTMSGMSAHELSTRPTAISWAVSMQRHTGEARSRSTRTPWLRKASPSALACARPISSMFRCVLQSSILKPGGSPPYPGGALPWRIRATWPPLTRAAHDSLASSAASAGVMMISETASAKGANRRKRHILRDSITVSS